jgi:membrane-associated protease RseP (regulator of RpoE activity)
MSMALRKLAGFGPGAGSDDGSPAAGADGADRAETPAAPPVDPPEPADTPLTPANQRGALLRLLIFLVAAAVVSVMAGVGKTVAVVLAIILMIVLHEAGHFVMAKLAGIKVTEFFVGFGPRLWSIRRGETEYGVKALPLGGYVKIIGMNNLEQVDPADEPRTYRQQPYLRRLSVAVAGSAVHFLIALALLFTVFYVTGDRGLLVTPSANQVTVGSVNSLASGPSPAQLAGLAVGDRILAVDGQRFKTWDAQVAYIQARPNTAVDLEVDRHGQIIHLHPTTIDLSKVQVNGVPAATQPTGFIGFAGAYPTFRYGFFSSINHAGGAFVKVTAQNFDALKGLFSPHGIASYSNVVVDKKAADSPTAVRLVSPVGMVRLANQLVGNGLEDVLFLLILINLFVGMFNMIPLLPLDGGHVAIATYEAIRSRRGRRYQADVTKLLPFVYATLLIIVFLGASSLYVDMRDLLSIGF